MKAIKDIIVKGSIFAVLTAVFCMGGVPAAPLVSTALAEVVWSGDITYDNPEDPIIEDVTLTGNTTLTVAGGKTLSINGSVDCTGKTLTIVGPGTVSINGAIDISNGNVILTGGTLNVSSGLSASSIDGNVTITGGTLNAIGKTGEGDNNGGSGIYGKVTLNGGTLNATGGNGGSIAEYGGCGIQGDVIQTGGTLNAIGGDCLVCPGQGIKGKVTLSGGTLTATGGKNDFYDGGHGILGDVELTGGTLIATGGVGDTDGGYGIFLSFDGNVKLTDGTLKVTGGEKIGGGNGSAFNDNGSVIIDEGKVFTINGTQSFSGTLNDNDKAAIAGKFLTSYPAMIGESYYPIQDAMDAAAEGATLKLLKDVQTVSPVTIDKEITLDLNGHTIDRGLGKSEAVIDGNVIRVENSGNLTLSDSSETKTGLITGGNNIKPGGGVYVFNGSFTMKGGAISGNSANQGGGVNVTNGSFTMNDGKINDNTAVLMGGGVYASGDNASFTMNGGEISGNKADQGGGVYVNDNAKVFTITGGTITDNTGKKDESDITQNVFLCNGKIITIGDKLANTTSIGITVEVAPTAESPVKVTRGWKTYMDGEDPSHYFTSDNPEYLFFLNDGEIVLDRQRVSAPKFSPEEGTYTSAKSVAITSDTEGADIYYTVDGSTPTTFGTRYSKPVSVMKTTTIKAIAVKAGMNDSDISSATYTISSETPVNTKYKVTVNNGSGDGEYEKDVTVTIKADDPAEGKAFDKWISDDGVEFADAASTETTFKMPANAVTVTATYKDKEADKPDPDDPGQDDPKPVNPDPANPDSGKVPDKVPVTDPSSSYAAPEDNFAPVAPGSSEGTGGNIKKLELDFSNVKASGVDPGGLKMTAINGSKFTTKAKVKDKNSVHTDGGVKAKFNKKDSTVTITCKNSGKATFDMEDGNSYTVAFTVEKPKPNKSEGKLTAGSVPVTKTVKDLFGISITGGKLTVLKEKVGGQVTPSGNGITINPAEKNTIKVQYQYLNKKYKMSIKVK